MTKASIRDLRTHFPRIRRILEEEGEVIVTDRGKPVLVMRPYDERNVRQKPIDYFARLKARMPKPLSKKARRALDEADRGER